MKNEKLKQVLYLILGIAICIFCYKIIPYFYDKLLSKLFIHPSLSLVETIYCLLEIIIITFLFIIYHKRIIEDLKKFKKDYRKKLDIGFKYYFIGFAVMAISNILLAFILGGMAENEALNRETLKVFPVYSILAMVLIGPMVEELIFRLGFKKAFNNWLPYAIFSAVLFGGLHVYTAYANMPIAQILKNWHEILYIVPYGSLGFAFAKAFYETDNIWTTITIHTLHNAFTIFLIILS